MNQSDMILEFIDGTLDSGNEQSLFDDMAHHPELRAELRQYVMIGDAVRADREAYTPPADVERRLLGGLGFFPVAQAGGAAAGAAAAVGGTAAATTASAFGWLALANLKSVLLPLVVGLLLGVTVGGGGVYLIVQGSSDPGVVASSDRGNAVGSNGEAATDRSASPASPSTASANAAGSSAPGLSSGQGGSNVIGGAGVNGPIATERKGNGPAGQDRVSTRVGRQRENANNTLVPSSSSNEVNAMESNQDVVMENGQMKPAETPAIENRLELTSMLPEQTPLIDRENLLPDEPKAHRSPTVLSMPLPTAEDEGRAKEVFALELRKGFVSQPFADNAARPVQKDFLGEDVIVGAYYATHAKWYLGLEAGRERYTQSLFYNQGETLFVEQRPVVGWGGVAFGRKMEVFDLPLFLQGTLGASQYGGPMMRGRIGFDITDLFGRNAPSAFSLPISFEASSLVYTYNGQYLVTGNWGISGGVRLRFGF